MIHFFRGFRARIFFTLAALVALFGLALLLFVKLDYSRQLRTELEKRGISIARHLATQSIAPLLSHDPLSVKLAAFQTLQAEEDIAYIYYYDPRRGAVLAHTFGAEFPVELLETSPLPSGSAFRIAHLETEEGPIYDVAVPIGQGFLGQVHVGLSGQPVSQAVGLLIRDIVLTTLLLTLASLLLSLPISAALARPLRRFSQAARDVAAGRFEQPLSETRRDEVGELAASFNHMARQLRHKQQELVERNQLLTHEVAQRQLAETELSFQLSFLATLMDEIPEPVFYQNTRGLFLGCNRTFEEFFGLAREQVIGRRLEDLFPPDQARIHAEANRELFATRGRCQYELRVSTAHGGVQRQVICKKATFDDSDGQLAGLIGVIIDVTAERELDQLRREFVSTTAHEFQTPLTAIIGFCDLLLNLEDNSESERAEFTEIIRERAEFLSRMVKQFLNLSRIEAGQKIPLNLAPCHPLLLIEKLLANQSTNPQRFALDFPAHCPPILVDEDRLSQAVDNLLSNAVKYSPAEEPIVISGSLEKGMLCISVQDQGVGIAPDKVERIFDKFFRADTRENAPPGTGLGLYITRAIIEAHGGSIQAASQLGKGTTIRFTLPLAPMPRVGDVVSDPANSPG